MSRSPPRRDIAGRRPPLLRGASHRRRRSLCPRRRAGLPVLSAFVPVSMTCSETVAARSRSFQDGQHGHGAAEEL
jgi:hypothetical protein